MRYAIIKTGGKQYKVQEGDILEIEKVDGKAKSKLEFDQVLMIADEDKLTFGQPLIKGAKVLAKIVEQFRGPKIKVAKFKAKSRYRKTQGHRQQLTKIEISKIALK